MPYSGNNQKASVIQFIGPVKVSIDYSSPKVHSASGEDRRGKIWGTLVPYGMGDLGFPPGRMGPWRAGANENTVFAVSHPVLIEGKPLAAGRYGLHMLPAPADDPQGWTLIFSRNSTSWGSFTYDPAEDALRVTVKPRKSPYREYLTYEFVSRDPAAAVAEMQWEELAVPWSIRVENIDDIYLSRLEEEMRNAQGFNWQNINAAARWALGANKLDAALKWADKASGDPYVGQPNFTTLATKAAVLAKMGRDADAKPVMEKALNLPGTSPTEIHMYGRQLLTAGKKQEAMEIFLLNEKRNGDTWPVHVGLARGYMANGDAGKALEHAKIAAGQAPDPLNKKNMEAMVQALSSGQTFNN